MKIFPAIDLIDGRCVRLSQGDYERVTVYDDNPLIVARRFASCGIRRLHVVDLDGAKAAAPRNLRVLESIVSAMPYIEVEWGGGIKDENALRAVLDAGAAWAVCECFVKFPALTFPLLRRKTLPAFTQNKAIQKIRESYRVSREDKEALLACKK